MIDFWIQHGPQIEYKSYQTVGSEIGPECEADLSSPHAHAHPAVAARLAMAAVSERYQTDMLSRPAYRASCVGGITCTAGPAMHSHDSSSLVTVAKAFAGQAPA